MDKSSSLGMSMHHPKKNPRSTSVKAWGCPCITPRNIQEIQAGVKLGDADTSQIYL
jgi:hypothetical protein